MAGAITRFDKIYSSGPLTMGASAQTGDILVVAGSDNNAAHITVSSVTGVSVGSWTEQKAVLNVGGNTSAAILTAAVTSGGAPPVITITGSGSDRGFGAWIVSGASQSVTNSGSVSGGTNPNASSGAGASGTLICHWANEAVGAWSAWTNTGGTTNDEGENATHFDRFGDQVNVASGTYTVGVTATASDNNMTLFIYLPDSGGAVTSTGFQRWWFS